MQVLLKNFMDACIASLSFWLIGYAFAFGQRDTTNGELAQGLPPFHFACPSSRCLAPPKIRVPALSESKEVCAAAAQDTVRSASGRTGFLDLLTDALLERVNERSPTCLLGSVIVLLAHPRCPSKHSRLGNS